MAFDTSFLAIRFGVALTPEVSVRAERLTVKTSTTTKVFFFVSNNNKITGVWTLFESGSRCSTLMSVARVL